MEYGVGMTVNKVHIKIWVLCICDSVSVSDKTGLLKSVSRWLFSVDFSQTVWCHAAGKNTYLAEEMTTECCSELRILVRWAATESS